MKYSDCLDRVADSDYFHSRSEMSSSITLLPSFLVEAGLN